MTGSSRRSTWPPFTAAAESLVGVAVIPVSAVPVAIELGAYELDADGTLREIERAAETVHVPLAHTEGGLTASLTRGSLAAGTVRTFVLADRITRASCFVCADAAHAVQLAEWLEGETDDMRDWLESSDDPSLSRHARLRELETHVVGPMCHVLWRWTTGDAVGPNMMTRNAYALNMGYVMQRAPVKPERAILEANMGGDKKPSHEYFRRGHGKSVLAEAFVPDEQIGRVLRTTAEDLEALSWAGTHGAVASGMQSVAFTPASAIAAVFAATGQDLGMVGTSSMAHGTGRRVAGRNAGLDSLRRARGRDRRRRHDPPLGPRVARVDRLRRPRQGLSPGPDRRGRRAVPRAQRIRGDGDGRQRELLPSAPRTGRPSVIALVFAYETHDGPRFEEVYGSNGPWASFLSSGAGYVGTELLRDVEQTGRYVVVDRWETRDAYNHFIAENRDEYMRRVDETAYLYRQELRLGTFENVWADGNPAAP